MRISVITINFNNGAGLKNTVTSVIEQDYCDVEYLVIDGGSKDDSVDIIKKLSSKIYYWISELDDGIYHAMNKGINKASGKYLIFLNSGDCFNSSSVITCMVANLKKNIDTDVLYGNVVLLDPNTHNVGKPVVWRYPSQLTLTFFKQGTINHQASAIRASIFSEIGPYPEHFKIAADYWLFLMMMLHNKKFTFIDEVLVKYDSSGITASDGYGAYAVEMKRIWYQLVPLWAQQLVDENTLLLIDSQARMVRLATRVNGLLRKAFGRAQ